MKNIIAVIRSENAEQTLALIRSHGVHHVMDVPVHGRGERRGFIRAPNSLGAFRRHAGIPRLQFVNPSPYPEQAEKPHPGVDDPESRFAPGRMLIALAEDRDVPAIVDTIIRANRRGDPGDGKIFVCPLAGAIALPDIGSLP